MFERFTTEARQTVVLAQQEARELGSGHIGTEHLLLGLMGQGGTPVADLLGRHGLDRASTLRAIVRLTGGPDLDADALGAVGIDLAAVRERVEARSARVPWTPVRRDGAGNSPATSRSRPRAKKVLELSLREAIALKSTSIGDAHILLGLLREGEGLAMKMIHDRGIDVAVLRDEVRSELSS